MEPRTGIEPVTAQIQEMALYQLSYRGGKDSHAAPASAETLGCFPNHLSRNGTCESG